MLIKKTIVLQSAGATVGYVTLVRVGSEVGVKTVLNVTPHGTLTMGIKTTSGTLYTQEIVSARTESKPNLSLMPTDEVGIVLVDDSGNRFAEGGRKKAVNVSALIKKTETPIKQTIITSDEPVEASFSESTINSAQPVIDQSPDIPEQNVADEEPPSASEENSETMSDTSVSDVTQGDLPPFYVNKGENFYKNIRSRLNDIMTENPREEELEKLIPESKWVRVYYDRDEYYVVGILSEEGTVTFLAYGVPGVEGIRPPKEAEELCDFLPIPGTPQEGYWIMFQNASNGEIAKSI